MAALPTTNLGHSGIPVSTICLGTMLYGTTTPEVRGRELLEQFLDRGGTFVDTANN